MACGMAIHRASISSFLLAMDITMSIQTSVCSDTTFNTI